MVEEKAEVDDDEASGNGIDTNETAATDEDKEKDDESTNKYGDKEEAEKADSAESKDEENQRTKLKATRKYIGRDNLMSIGHVEDIGVQNI